MEEKRNPRVYYSKMVEFISKNCPKNLHKPSDKIALLSQNKNKMQVNSINTMVEKKEKMKNNK